MTSLVIRLNSSLNIFFDFINFFLFFNLVNLLFELVKPGARHTLLDHFLHCSFSDCLLEAEVLMTFLNVSHVQHLLNQVWRNALLKRVAPLNWHKLERLNIGLVLDHLIADCVNDKLVRVALYSSQLLSRPVTNWIDSKSLVCMDFLSKPLLFIPSWNALEVAAQVFIDYEFWLVFCQFALL